MTSIPRCERCHGTIPAERLEAVPGTRICVKCSKVVGGDTTIVMADENLAKRESLKKNYGSVSARVVRKERDY